jgi:hypothetical protein
VPSGISDVVTFDTDFMVAIYRTQLIAASDLDNVKRVQAGYRVTPLSKFAGTPASSAVPPIRWIDPLLPNDERTSLGFFNVLAWVLQYCPVLPEEAVLRERFGRLGVAAGWPFDPNALSPELRQALRDGMADGQQEIDAARARTMSSAALFGTREQMQGNYLNRAIATQMGILGNSAAEATYLMYDKDANQQSLSGTNSYALRFAPGQLPPVDAFWSITMYDLPEQFLVENPLHRYLINSPMLPQLSQDADGGYTIDITNASPGKQRESNWLPAPAGPFMLVLRCYYPKESVLDGTWKQPPLVMRMR